MPTNRPGYWSENGGERYKKYHGSRSALDKRNNRNKARRKLGIKDWDPREVDHKDSNALNNSRSNLRAVNRTFNRRRGAMKANGK